VSLYGGSFDTVRPSFEVGGSQGNLSYFADGSYDHNALGIENPTPSADADPRRLGPVQGVHVPVLHPGPHEPAHVHGQRVVQRLPGARHARACPPGTSPDGKPWLPGRVHSAGLNENQNEQNYYGVVAYQKSAGDLNYQLSAVRPDSSVHFTPDPVGDLYFNGVASDVDRTLYSGGVQGDGSYASRHHTLRAGFSLLDESVSTRFDDHRVPGRRGRRSRRARVPDRRQTSSTACLRAPTCRTSGSWRPA
jgi:hypothetical protein